MERQLAGIYASRHTVAEMKLTNRGKDWPFVTALGIKLLGEGDIRGCLHLYAGETLRATVRARELPPWMFAARPALRLALAGDDRLDAVIQGEQIFWQQLDACRIRIYERALRPYVSAVRKAIARRELLLAESHAIRVACAEQHLPESPLVAHGLEQLVRDARAATERVVHPALMEWLPTAITHFTGLS